MHPGSCPRNRPRTKEPPTDTARTPGGSRSRACAGKPKDPSALDVYADPFGEDLDGLADRLNEAIRFTADALLAGAHRPRRQRIYKRFRGAAKGADSLKQVSLTKAYYCFLIR